MGKRRGAGDGSVFQLPDGRWRAQIFVGYTPAGSRRYKTKTVGTRTEASRALRDLLREQSAGLSGHSGATPSVKAWAEAWLEDHAHNVRPNTFTTDAGAVRRWIIPTIGHRRLDQLTPADVRAVSRAVEAAGRTSTTARHAQNKLNQILMSASQEGHPVPQRCLHVKRPAPAISDRDAIPLQDVAAILRAAERMGEGQLSRWMVAFFQGLRQGEALGLTWDCVDLDAGTLDVSWQLQDLPYRESRDPASGFRVPRAHESRQLADAWHLTRPKTMRGRRVIPLVPSMRDHLAAWGEQWPENPWRLVWAHVDTRAGRHDRPIPRSGAADRAEWNLLQDVADVRRVRDDGTTRPYVIHEARHTTATLLLRAGVDPHVMTAIMGHSSITTTRGYQHVDQQMQREAMAAIARQLAIEAA